MNILKFRFLFFIFSTFLLTTVIFPTIADAQRRDYMTDEEIEITREMQEIDLRVDVLTKMIERRFAVLNNQPSPIKKDSELWGAPPKGTRTELLSDINKLLQKAIDDIDDVAEHNRMDSKLFPKAMRNLSASATNFLPLLKTEFDKAADEKEKGLILNSMDSCNQIIEASAKVPKEETKEEKKKKKNQTEN